MIWNGLTFEFNPLAKRTHFCIWGNTNWTIAVVAVLYRDLRTSVNIHSVYMESKKEDSLQGTSELAKSKELTNDLSVLRSLNLLM